MQMKNEEMVLIMLPIRINQNDFDQLIGFDGSENL